MSSLSVAQTQAHRRCEERGDEKRKTYGAVMPDSLPLWVMAEKEEKEEGGDLKVFPPIGGDLVTAGWLVCKASPTDGSKITLAFLLLDCRVLIAEKCTLLCCLSFSFSYDVRGNGVEIGRHWNDGVNLGARARFENAASAGPGSSSVLWVDDLREADRGAYRCRVDFRQAPTRNARINLEVIGERMMGGQFRNGLSYNMSIKLWGF